MFLARLKLLHLTFEESMIKMLLYNNLLVLTVHDQYYKLRLQHTVRAGELVTIFSDYESEILQLQLTYTKQPSLG